MSNSKGIEDVIEAPLETIRNAVKEVLGGNPKEQKLKDGSTVFTKDVSECPPQIKIIPAEDGKFRIISTSLCNVKDCDYWQRCAQLDSSNMQELKEAVAKLQGKVLPRAEKKWSIGEGKSRHVVDDALHR
ncbi:MAG: hypothetical protein WED04_05340 [Promethearchaeati archaeon SRVP18_Atabeyarchaeia-1]